MEMLRDHIEPDLMDDISVLAGLGVLVGWLPTVLSLVTIAWFGIRIWESDTVRGLTNRKEKTDETQN
jgi:UPF0716 family protein affecting phage T7 exclusion